jgi:flagellar biosynthesis protein FlhB
LAQAARQSTTAGRDVLAMGIIRGLALVAAIWLAMGIFDFFWRLGAFRRSLRLSERELREALRALSGNPEVRRLLREQRQRTGRPLGTEINPP